MSYQQAYTWRTRFAGLVVACTTLALSTESLFAQTSPVILVSSTALTFTAGAGQNPPSQTVFIGSSGASLTLNATATTSTGGGWLQYSFDSGTTPANLTVSPQAASLQPGTYQGQIQVSASASNSPLTITVSLTVGGSAASPLSASPSILNFSAQLNGTPPPAQTIAIGPTNSSVGFTASVSTGTTAAQWLQVTPLAATTPQLLSVTVNTQGLTGGNYTGTINIIPNAQGAGTVNVVVNLTVNALPTLNYSPAQGLQFYFQSGTTFLSPPQGLAVSSSSGTLTLAVGVTTGNGVPWLNVGQTLVIVGTTPIQVPISISSLVASFQPGNYTGAIVLTAPGAINPSVAIPVSLQVSTLPLMSLGNAPNPFLFRAGQPPPFPQTMQIGVSSGQLPFTASVILAPGQNWLTISPDSGTLPNALSISVDATGLSSGTYSGQIRIDSPSAANSPQTFPVTLNVSANGLLLVSPVELDFNFELGMSAPPAQTLNIGTTGGTATFNIQPLTNNCGSTWLSASPASGPAPGSTVKVSINPAGIAVPGLCTGRLGIVNQNGVQTIIPINLSVSGNPLMNVAPRLLSFTTPSGGVQPPTQSVQLASTDPNNQIFYTTQVSTSNGGNWLSIPSNATGQTPATVPLAANPGNLVPGTYSGVLIITPTGLTPISVSVTMIVTSNIGMGVSPPSITITSPAGNTPGPQILNLTSQGGTLPYSATALSATGWLSVTPPSGTTPAQLVVSFNPTGLAPGTYAGSITIASTQASNPALSVPVSLVVTPAQNLTIAPMSLTFNSTVGDASAPPAQAINLTPTAGTLSFQASTQVSGSVSWLSINPSSGTAPLAISVTVDPTNLAPGLYSGTVTITPVGLPQVVIPVSYSVAAPPLPSITSIVNVASLLGGPVAPGEIVTLQGANTGPTGNPVLSRLNSDGSLPLSLGDTQVLFDTYFAPILSLGNNSVTVVVPYEVAGEPTTLIQVKVKSVYSNLLQIPVVNTVPGIFTANAPLSTVGAILNADGTPNSPTNPAMVNTAITIYYTGDGVTNPATPTNGVNPATPPFPVPALLLTATLGGATAPVTSYGPVPGSFAGISAATITVPPNLGPGPQPLFVFSDIVSSQGGVFVTVSN